MYTNINQIKNTKKLTAWIYQVTRNMIADHYRRQSKPIIAADIESDNEARNLSPEDDCVHYVKLYVSPIMESK